MADSRCRLRSRQGKFTKRANVNRSGNLIHIRKHQEKEFYEHDYYRDEVNDEDVDVALNVTVAVTEGQDEAEKITWEDGRRVVELSHMAQQMHCDKCQTELHLCDIIGEKRYGLGSLLEIRCRNCQWVKLISTGKRNEKGGFDINYKVALAMVHSGMGATHVVNFLSSCNIPPPDPSTLRKKEKELSIPVTNEATDSCSKASKEEKNASNGPMECSFDGGWQKRGSGWQYNSNSGHASLIGSITGKVTEFDLRTRSCSICQYHKGRGGSIPTHECNTNWTGSSKGMEPDMAITMLHKMREKGYEVSVLHSDNDSTTAARLKTHFSNLIKKDDRNHIKKNLSKQLYGAAKKFKELKPPGVIPYIKRCYMYAIQSHQSADFESLNARLDSIVPHLYGDHKHCSSDWCKYKTDPSKYRYKHLPNGKALQDEDLRQTLEDVSLKLKNRSVQLTKLGSSQANENFNHMMASKAPKNRTYGGSKSLKTRLGATVLQKNEGYTWVNKVYKRVKLSPGTISLRIGKSMDKRREYLKTNSARLASKRNRIALKKKTIHREEIEEVKEGETYGSSIAESLTPDIETIPSPYVIDNNTFIVFDLEATGLSRKSDITQISASDGNDSFNLYVKPRCAISKAAGAITGLQYLFDDDQMLHNGKPVESKQPFEALLSFVEYIQTKENPILVGHNILSYDIPVLTNALREHGLLSSSVESVYGCLDTMLIAKKVYPKKSGIVCNYKQETLVKSLLGDDFVYQAHNAMEDVRSLCKLFDDKLKDKCSGNDIFPLNVSSLQASYEDMMKQKVVGNKIVQQLARSGLAAGHLKLAHKRDTVKGLRNILKEHGFGVQTSNKIYKYLQQNEE